MAKKLNLSSIYNSLFAQGFEAHDTLGDCQALSEVLLAIMPNMNIIEFAGLLRSAKEMKKVLISRKDVRYKVISLQKLHISKP